MKRFLLILLAIILITAAALAAYFYFYPKEAQNILIPEIEHIENVKIKLVGDTARLDLALKFENHGPFKMNIDSLIYNIKFDTATILSRAQDLEVILRPGQSDTFRIPIKLPFKRLIANIKRVQDQDSVPILSDIRIVYSTIFGRASLPHQKTTTIGVPRPPKFELERMEFVSRDKKTIYLKAHLKMINKGKIELKLYNLRYNIKVEDLFTAEGKHPKVIIVKPASVMHEVLPITVDVKRAFKTAMKILTNNDKVKYKIKLIGEIEADKLGEERTEIEINQNGIMELKK